MFDIYENHDFLMHGDGICLGSEYNVAGQKTWSFVWIAFIQLCSGSKIIKGRNRMHSDVSGESF